MYKLTSTGLPDEEYEKNPKVGNSYKFFNGSMSNFDNKTCMVIEKASDGKFRVVFDDGVKMLAYCTELRKLDDAVESDDVVEFGDFDRDKFIGPEDLTFEDMGRVIEMLVEKLNCKLSRCGKTKEVFLYDMSSLDQD